MKGTFDVSLLSIDEGVFEVLATAGDTSVLTGSQAMLAVADSSLQSSRW